MRDAVPPCEMRYRGEAGTGRRSISRRRPGRPRHPTRRSRRARPHPDAPGGDPSGPSRPAPAPQRPQRPLASHRETHSDAFATTLRTRRTPPSRPPPQPSCSMSSKPPPNNLRESVHWKSTFQKNLGIMRKTPNPPAGAPLSNVQHPARPERSRIARERSSARPLPGTRPRPNSAGGRPAAPILSSGSPVPVRKGR